MRGLARRLYFWVLVGIVTGCVLGIAAPATAVTLKPLSDGFINLVKMLIGPIVFLTVVLGFAGAGDLRKVGRVGIKALVYFEVVSTLALIIGLIVAKTMKPGAGFNIDPASLDTSAVATYTNAAATQSAAQFILHIIPRTFADAFSGSGDMLQVLLRGDLLCADVPVNDECGQRSAPPTVFRLARSATKTVRAERICRSAP